MNAETSPAPRPAGLRFRWAAALRVGTFPTLVLLLVAALLLNAGMGAVAVSPVQVLGIVLERLGLDTGIEYTTQQSNVVWLIRLPRVALALAVGAGLGIAGAALQGIFRNPLADPGLIGVSSGGALGALFVILVGVAPLGQATLPVAAFLGAFVLTMVVYGLSRSDGKTEVVTLILTGVALNAIAGGLMGLMNFYADDEQLRNMVFWLMGSLAGATWQGVLPATLLIAVGTALLAIQGRALNLLVLGEREAFHLGLSTERTRIVVIVMATLVAGASVAVAGIISFVGLVVPHFLRLTIGPDHRSLLPASALGGAVLLLIADLVARTIAIPAELPLGVVTALIGGPYFLYLLRRTRREQGGWG